MHSSLKKAIALAIVGCALIAGEASATWIRVLFVEHTDGSGRDMAAIQQVWGGNGPWNTTDPNLGAFFGNYTTNYSVSNVTAHTISLTFDLYADQSDPQSGAAQANIGAYNFFDPASGALTATLEVSQASEHVTVAYASAIGGATLMPLANATPIDGVPALLGIDDVFGGADGRYLPVCDTNGCPDGRFPLGLGVAVTRIPEPMTLALVAVMALGARAARRRSSDRRT